MSTTTLTPRRVTSARLRGQRLLAVGGAVLAAVASWAFFVHGLGLVLRAPAAGGQPATDVGAGEVVIASAVASLSGWGTLALLERLSVRARKLWAGLALGVLVVSFGGPLSGAGISMASRLALVALHVVVAAVLVPVLYRTSARRRPAA